MSRDKTTTSGIPLTFKKIKLLFNRFERLNVITSIQAEFGHERSPKNKILPWDTSQWEVRRASLHTVYPLQWIICKMFL